MKFFIASDVHADASTNGLDRFDEIRDALFVVADAAIRSQINRNPSVFIFAGDLCDPDTTRSFRAIGLAIAVALHLAKENVPSIWIAGNHDVIENDRGSTTLEPLKAVAEKSDLIQVHEKAWPIVIGNRRVIVLPFTARTASYEPKAAVAKFAQFDPHLVVGHLTVPSAERGSESDDFARGRDMIFPVEECRKRWGDRCILVNGHYHRKQITKDGVHIPGSLARLRHDEEQHEPGYLVIEV
jgi:DNA repair exonuclease SbcCD nuclease subunit